MATLPVRRTTRRRPDPESVPADIGVPPDYRVTVTVTAPVAIPGLVHDSVPRTPGETPRATTRVAGPPAAPRVIRRQKITAPVPGTKSPIELDTDNPAAFRAGILKLKQAGGRNQTNDSVIIAFMEALSHAGTPARPLHAFCVDVLNTSHADLNKTYPELIAKPKAAGSATAAKPKPIKFGDLGVGKDSESVEAKKTELAARWGLARNDRRFKAAVGSQASFTFMSSLDPKLRQQLVSPLKGGRLDDAVAIIEQKQVLRAKDWAFKIRCLSFDTLTPQDKNSLEAEWLAGSDKLSSAHRLVYQERVKKALEKKQLYDHFLRLPEDERLYTSAEDFEALRKVTSATRKAFNRLVTDDREAAARERQAIASSEAKLALAQDVQAWNAFATTMPGEVECRLIRAGFTADEPATQAVEQALAQGLANIQSGTPSSFQQTETSEQIRKALIDLFFGTAVTRNYPYLAPHHQRATREAMKADSHLDVGDIVNALSDAWDRQRNSPVTKQDWATWMNVRLKTGAGEGNDFNPLPTICDLGRHVETNPVAHYSVGEEGITVPRVTRTMTARELVDQMFGSDTVDPRRRVHVTLETGVVRDPPRNQERQCPHKYWTGLYDYSFAFPENSQNRFNRWNREAYHRNPGPDPRTEEGHALVKDALDRAFEDMDAELIRRAEHILSRGAANPA